MKKLLGIILLSMMIGCTNLSSDYEKISFVQKISENYIIDLRIPKFKLERVTFAPYSADLSKTYYKELDNFIVNFKKYCSSTEILLTGYIDSKEKEMGFDNLGKQRAMMIKNYMMEQGIPEKLIIVSDLGGVDYPFSNDTPIGKAKNRSVKIEAIREKY